MKKRQQYILTIIFLVFLISPHILQKMNLLQANTKNENRAISEKPELDFNHLDKYPKQYDSYFNDNFGFRSFGLKAYNNFNYFFLKKSPSPKKAILGKDGWLFQGKDMEYYRGSKRLTNTELEKLETEFKKREAFLAKQNCRFIFTVIPTKKEIYPEYLPDEYFRYSDKTMTDQFLDMLRTKTKVEVIDLRKVIRDAKKVHPILYHKMDNHWNDISSYYAYKTIINHIGKTTPLGETHDYNEYELDTTIYQGGSIAKMLGIQDSLVDYRLKLKPKFNQSAIKLPKKYPCPERFPYSWAYEKRFKTDNDELPRLMMINDSFGEYLYPFLSEHFSYSLFLFDAWELKLHAQKVIEEKPDIFIITAFEGFIPNILNNLHRIENKIPDAQ